MKSKLSGTWRFNVVFGLLMLAVPALCVHMWMLMRDRSAQAARLAEMQARMTIPIPARTGTIFARTRNGWVPLAISRQSPGVFVDPKLLESEKGSQGLPLASKALAPILAWTPERVQKEILARGQDSEFVWLQKDLNEPQATAVKALDLPGIGLEYEWRRFYPSGGLASQVVGFRLGDGLPGGGIELSMKDHLAADSGKQICIADAGRRPIWVVQPESKPPRDGNHVFLFIDAVIQETLEKAVAAAVDKYEAHWGVGVVMDPYTGQVMAMCSMPSFDPNQYTAARDEDRTNRAIVMPFEPGSVFKPIIAASAVDCGALTWETKIDCGDGVYIAAKGGRISDHGNSYGVLTLWDVIVHSSNIGMAHVGEKLGNSKQFEILRQFNFGQPTGVELPGEDPGLVRQLSKWDGYSLRRVPFGQEVGVTALQLITAYCPLVNGGMLLRPHLVDQIAEGDRVLYKANVEPVRRVLKESNSNTTRLVLQDVVERGTGKACQMERWTSLGKTGTAQIPVNGHYTDEDYAGSFLGAAPVGHPRVLCLITIYRPNRHKGYYGGAVAAPAVKEVLEKTMAYLNVPEDIPPGERAKRKGAGPARGW